MTTPTLMPSPRQKFTDNNGDPLANGMLFTYAAGTSTPLAAYQDPAGTIAHPNPIRLDARGEATVYFIGNYKIDLKTSAGNQVPGYPVDNFNTDPTGLPAIVAAFIASLASSIGASLIGFLQAGVGAIVRTLQAKSREIVSPEDFGAVGDNTADDRAAIEKALIYLNNIGGGSLRLTKKYLLNSFSADSALATAHGQILPMFSNIKYVFEGGAQLTIGTFFDDKNFVAISGYNAANPVNFTDIKNVEVQGGVFDFAGATSQMRGAYRLRLAITFGRINRGKVIGTKFQNGDLSNCIGAGYLTLGNDLEVAGCTFEDLVQENTVNSDHTSIYANATNSRIHNNHFKLSSKQGARVAAAVELHKSNSSWTGGSVFGYTRGGYMVATTIEGGQTTNINVSGVNASVTNGFEYCWTDTGCRLSDVRVHNNNVTCLHITGEAAPGNGAQGLLVAANDAAGKGGDTEDIVVSDNTLKIAQNLIAGTATMAWFEKTQQGVKFLRNICTGVKDGVHIAGAGTDTIAWIVEGNRFYSDNVVALNFFAIGGRNVTQSHFTDNYFDFGGTAYDKPVAFTNSGTVSNTTAAGINIMRNKPATRDLLVSASFSADQTNRAVHRIYAWTLTYPTIGTGLSAAAVLDPLPTADIRTGSTVTWEAISTPVEVALCPQVTADTYNNVKFVFFNKSGALYSGAVASGDVLINL